MRGSKPGERRGGRQKGTPNKLPAAVKDMITGALDRVGGVDYLSRQAEQNPTAFLTLLGKVLPLQVSAGLSSDATIIVHTGVPRADD